ncbi:MAG: GTPase [Planctomycetota bacterium]
MVDDADTIVAPATPRAPGERAAVRLAGPDALGVVGRLTDRSIACLHAQRFENVALRVPIGGAVRPLPCDLFVWPDTRSYTRQPAVEIHTVGSPPIVDAMVAACLDAGARLAEPGEFTLRACLAGRIDLLQAEAVLAVIDARHQSGLQAALGQLAGGLSRPLAELREALLGLLADLEAGLDFVDEEDVRFVEPEELTARLAQAAKAMERIARQTSTRRAATEAPRVALVGPPNVGKSRLFNALVERFGGNAATRQSLVADQPGVTRDEVTATVRLDGVLVELIDTPGQGEHAVDAIDAQAQRLGVARRDGFDLLLDCAPIDRCGSVIGGEATIVVGTMADRFGTADDGDRTIVTSAATGLGIDRLAKSIVTRLADAEIEATVGGVVGATATRCADSLMAARHALEAAAEGAAAGAGDELVSFDLRRALDAIGRVTGEVVTDDVLDQIFGKFCIGK